MYKMYIDKNLQLYIKQTALISHLSPPYLSLRFGVGENIQRA